ncbi:hypothetical protein DSM43276_00546 [Mycobacteroides salmoniphilum]|nr:hypothetical protein DSM43276_00546 [Mycobacteroides salmoniphilum]
MADARDARRVFDAGVLSLGIPIDRLETDHDVVHGNDGEVILYG